MEKKLTFAVIAPRYEILGHFWSAAEAIEFAADQDLKNFGPALTVVSQTFRKPLYRVRKFAGRIEALDLRTSRVEVIKN